MSHTFGRHCHHLPPKAQRAEGVYIFDAAGKKYLDGSGGAAVSCIGHSDPAVLKAIKNQIETLAFAHTAFFSSDVVEKLSEKLCDHAPGLDKVYLVSGGSEAVEAAIKLARQYHLENGEPSRTKLIARQQSYHGNTLGALATGGNMWRRAPFDPILVETSLIEPCYAYRAQNPDESDKEYGLRAAKNLETEILRLGPENVMAFVAEPVVGATAGALSAAPGYFREIRKICDRYGVLLILDEVMCGMGRTGSLFAYTQEDIEPDIIALAKGLGAGYQPIGAMMCSQQIFDVIKQGSGYFQHGHTYCGHPSAAAAALAVVTRLIDDGLVERGQKMGAYLKQCLDKAFGRHPFVGDIRGRGMFWGIELVQDRETKAPFSPDLNLAAQIKKQAFENGLVIYPNSGTIDGQQGDHILLAPPFIIEKHQIDELVEKLQHTLHQILGRINNSTGANRAYA